jgi:hypothetical protein
MACQRVQGHCQGQRNEHDLGQLVHPVRRHIAIASTNIGSLGQSPQCPGRVATDISGDKALLALRNRQSPIASSLGCVWYVMRKTRIARRSTRSAITQGREGQFS